MIMAHATCVAFEGKGVLLRGPSGCGKSDLALRAIAEGARLIADDYVYTHSNGAVNDKAADIKETMSDDIKWTDRKSEDLKVRTYGNVAVVTGQETLNGSAKNYVSGPRRFTEIWVKHSGHWQNVGGQTTLVPTK